MTGLPFRALCCASSLVLAASCAGSEDAPPQTLRFERFDPAVKEGVFLNEPLTFHFGSDVDPLSVGRESVVIESEQGERARGSLSVEGRRVVFQPDVPHAQDLSDGGYRPGTRYFVRLAGFPQTDGLRGVGGEPLARTERGSFTTVAVDAPRRIRLFDDPHQERRKPPDLFPGAVASADYLIGVGDPIYIACEKQIDPTSVRSSDFKLRRKPDSTREAEQSFDLFARLVENEPLASRERPRTIRTLCSDEQWRAGRRAALIELTPVQRLEPGRYALEYLPPEPSAGEETWSLRDFSLGRLVTDSPGFRRQINVVSAAEAGTRGESFVEDFVDTDLRTPKFVPDCDGTAAWTGSGRVEVHYPLAAGDGSAEAVALAGPESRTDLQATRIDLAKGVSCKLSDAPGLVVQRAQGRITLRGILARAAPFAEDLDCERERGSRLSDWLARAKVANKSWTVVIAGGDILIEGEIRSSVPVLLLAGGQVRNLGPGALPEKSWTQSGAVGLRALPKSGEAGFEIDPPVGPNPLRAPLRYAVVSGPVPQTGGVLRWNSVYSRGGFEPPSSALRPTRAGRMTSSFSVHYFPADSAQVPDVSMAPTSPAFLPQPGPVRFVVELIVGDEDDWQTPFLDRVQLEYEQPR